MRRALIVVGKAPCPGNTKTRLIPPLSADAAAQLYRAFLLDTLHLGLQLNWERTTVVHPLGDGPELKRLVPQQVHLLEQPSHGLGVALKFAFAHHFAAGFETVVLIGSDNPTLPSEPVCEASAALEDGFDLSIGPSADGGYYLIGMRQPHLGVFEGIDWSTARVYRQTLARAEKLGLRTHCVREWYDVDEPADLERLRAELSECPTHVASNTRLALERLALTRASRDLSQRAR